MKAACRLVRAIFHLFRGYWIISTKFSKLSATARADHVKQWSAQLLAIMGLQIKVIGAPIKSGMLVANHLSWLDNVAIHAAHFCRFVAKSDIKSWPVIGYLTDQSGMLFIERTSRRDAHRVVEIIAKQLQAGDCVAVFPEGTTGDGHKLLPFHANMIESAISADAIVQPVSIRYVDTASGQQTFAPSFIGDDTLLRSVWRTISGDSITAIIQFGLPQKAHGRDRRIWAADLRTSIHTMLT